MTDDDHALAAGRALMEIAARDDAWSFAMGREKGDAPLAVNVLVRGAVVQWTETGLSDKSEMIAAVLRRAAVEMNK